MQSFRYIYIPADTSDPIEERTLQYGKEREVECLLDEIKAHFARVRPPKTDAQRAAQLRELSAKFPADGAHAVNARLLDIASSLNMVESVALLPNMPSEEYVGINLYVDDEGAIRDAPFNLRASEFAATCGKPLHVRGDAFIARVKDDGDDFARLDFGTADLSSSAPWVTAARRKNAAAQSGPTAEAVFRQMQGQQQQNAGQAPHGDAGAEPGDRAAALKEQGNNAFRDKDMSRAVERYTAALAIQPTLVAARNNRSQAHLNLGHYKEAWQDAMDVLEVQPSNVKALLRCATAAKELGLDDQARDCLERLLQAQPGNVEAQTKLSELADAKTSSEHS